jgi:diphosphomevalonate decarboxylase
MSNNTSTAVGYSNIAFIKYWGNRDEALRLPANSSLSMNLDGLSARTSVSFDPSLPSDQFELNAVEQAGPALQRVTHFLDHVRRMAQNPGFARVSSANNFPTGAGIASSAAAFAALALAASKASGLELSESQLSRLARLGSGSAARSVPGGFVEWQTALDDEASYAFSIAPARHWDLVDCIAVISTTHKPVGSTEGHAAAPTSPLQPARVQDAPRRLEICRRAVLERDFDTFAAIVEHDSTLMHAVMMTSRPPLFYWQPASLDLMLRVPTWRAEGLACCFTLDAGPNVHILCLAENTAEVQTRLSALPGVQKVLIAHPGGPAHWVEIQ